LTWFGSGQHAKCIGYKANNRHPGGWAFLQGHWLK